MPISLASSEICGRLLLPVDRNPDAHACSKRVFWNAVRVDLPDILLIFIDWTNFKNNFQNWKTPLVKYHWMSQRRTFKWDIKLRISGYLCGGSRRDLLPQYTYWRGQWFRQYIYWWFYVYRVSGTTNQGVSDTARTQVSCDLGTNFGQIIFSANEHRPYERWYTSGGTLDILLPQKFNATNLAGLLCSVHTRGSVSLEDRLR